MRGLTRTLLARAVAVCLSVLAASPLTAPFMTCDWSERGHVRTDVIAHVARHAVATPDLKTPADLNTTTFTVAVTTLDDGLDVRFKASPLPAAPEHAAIRVLALRI